MSDREREHPDEGTIHAWLDGALDADTSRGLEAHVATCRACAERVAEARGLIAGASRIVSALDDAPTACGPAWGQAPVAPAAPTTAAVRRWWRVTPTRAAIAATVLVAVGVSLTYERAAVDSEASRVVPERGMATSTNVAAPTAAHAAPPARDPLLDSAVKRNIAAANPPRVVEPAPGPALPVPTPAPAAAVADPTAPTRVAAARAAIRAERQGAADVAPDQVAARAPGAARTAEDRAVASVVRGDSAALSKTAGIASGSAIIVQVAAPECYRVESANGVAAAFGAESLPLVVRIDSGSRAVMFTVAGQATRSQVAVARAGDDSLLLRLRRVGYEGTMALGAPGDARAGVMRSRQLAPQLEETVATSAPTASRARVRPSSRVPAAKQAPPEAPPTPEVQSALDAAPAVPVVARRTSCPR